MLTDITNILNKNRSAIWILAAGLIVQLVTCLTAIGVSSADQHFQIVEFSMYQLGKPSGASQVWEINNFVRPTLQVYLFSAFHETCNFLSVTDPYAQLTILRVLVGMIMFIVFNGMALYYFRKSSPCDLAVVLLLMNFSWALPYTRTLYSSEMISSLFFFGTLVLYQYRRNKQPGVLFLMLTGFLFSLAFFFRFQTAFAMVGVGIWLLFYEKKYRHIVPLLAGFAIGFVINVALDYGFYKEWVITPYTYFHANIIAGRADYFGTSSFIRYIGLLLLVFPAPFFSFVVMWYAIKFFFKHFSNPVLLSVVLFIVCHSLVGHKEERFLFPVFNALPVIAGWTIPYIRQLLQSSKKWLAFTMKGLLYFTLGLNILLLIVMTLIPFSQTILFSKLVKEKFENQEQVLYCIGQTPFETPNGSQMEFYKSGARNVLVKRLKNFKEVHLAAGEAKYISTSFKEVSGHLNELEKLGYVPVMSSSDLLWGLNKYLHSKGYPTIHEIWMLYRKTDN